MKKERECNMNVYPGMMPSFQMGPMMGGQMPFMGSIPNMQNNYGTGDLGSLTNQINSLEQRVNRLEGIVGSSNYNTNYSPNNFQVM
ncbi:MAG: hypothetical protein IKF01_03830 [Bacilli bacterium]|nr:hypothetical protein [Bacilli bacterium]